MLASAVLMAIGCDVVAAVDDRDEDIQLAYEGSHYDILTAESRSAGGRTVAAIQHLQTRSTAEHFSCGATFVAPHFAVTAGHCVANLVAGGTLPAGTFLVRTFDAVDMDVDEALELANVDTSGGWPNWESGSTFDYVNIAGLAVNTLECRVYCSGAACWDTVYANGVVPDGLSRPTLNGIGAVATPDIAVIECPGRTETFSAGVAADPNPAASPMAAAETRWFHEVVDLDITNTSGSEWLHYGRYDYSNIPSNLTNNYHYTWPHPLLALRTNKTAAGFTGRLFQVTRVANPSVAGTFVGTGIEVDVPGCHGTSGSGVFSAGSSYTYGPVLSGRGNGIRTGAALATSNEFCATRLGSAHPWTVRQFNRMTRLVNDRNGTYTPGF